MVSSGFGVISSPVVGGESTPFHELGASWSEEVDLVDRRGPARSPGGVRDWCLSFVMGVCLRKCMSDIGGCGSASLIVVGLSSLRDHVSAGCIFVGTHCALMVHCLSFRSCSICLSVLLRKGDVFGYPLMKACLAGRQSVSHRMGVGVLGGVCWSAFRNASVSSPGMELLVLAVPV